MFVCTDLRDGTQKGVLVLQGHEQPITKITDACLYIPICVMAYTKVCWCYRCVISKSLKSLMPVCTDLCDGTQQGVLVLQVSDQ